MQNDASTAYNQQMALQSLMGADGFPYVADARYDASGRVVSQWLGRYASNQRLFQQSYTYYPWTSTPGASGYRQGGRLQYHSIDQLDDTSTGGSEYLRKEMFSYGYDPVGNITQLTNSTGSQYFCYDALHRLQLVYTMLGSTSPTCNAANVPSQGLVENPEYDGLGRLIQKGRGSLLSYSNPSKLHAATGMDGNTYTYDANGNMTGRVVSGISYTLTYDGENRLVAYSGGTVGTSNRIEATFVYDGDGRRVQGTVNGVKTVYPNTYVEQESTASAFSWDLWVDFGAVWRYRDTGEDLGSTWRATSFNDTAWLTGEAPLGYGDGHEATRVGYGPDANNKYVTTYFRKNFYVSDPSLYDTIELGLTYDDGAVIYLNGTELTRVNLPGGTITAGTLATAGIEDTTATQTFAATGRLVAGLNVLAVEVHQNIRSSSDLHFDLKIAGRRSAASQVGDALIARGSSWKYFESSSAPGVFWYTPSFSDSTWATGPAVLGYGDGHETTTVSYGPDAANKYITTFFRKEFQVADPSAYAWLDLLMDYDDGAVVYLNGTELTRVNLPSGTITASTLAPQPIEDLTTILRFAATGKLVAGRNVLAVEVHQQSKTSSDLHLDVQLVGVRANNSLPAATWRSYYYAGTSPVAMRENGALFFLFHDHLGSTRLVTDAAGRTVGANAYLPWGGQDTPASSGRMPTTYRFTGQQEESYINLYWYGSRWYDPYLTQFTQPDSIIPDPYNPLDWNRYSYVRYNPVKYTDPTGHMSCELGDCRDGGYHVNKKFMQKVIKNEFNWNTDKSFSLAELQTIFASGWGIRTYVDGINGKGKEWMSKNLSSINFHRNGAPHDVVSFLSGAETDLVFLKNDIWLGSGVDKVDNAVQHVIHEISHVFDNNSGKGMIPAIWDGGGYGDRLTKFVGGNPSDIRWTNGSNGIPGENLWDSSVRGGYGNHSSADYFAEALSWTIVDSSKVPNPSIVNWINFRIVFTTP